MNETTSTFSRHPSWGQATEGTDRLLLDALVRLALGSGAVLTARDDAAVLALSLLVRAVRLEHVALSLSDASLSETLREIDCAEPSAGELVASLSSATPLVDNLIETINLGEDIAPTGRPIIISVGATGERYLHLRRLAHAEWRLSRALLDARAVMDGSPFDAFADGILSDLAPESAACDVASAAITHRISVVTGGPGTGKTTAVARFVSALGESAARSGSRPLSVALCAPTAKAAVRLRAALDNALSPAAAEGLDIDPRSGSVHRLLELGRGSGEHGTPIDRDLIVVDEVSMLELELMDLLIHRASPSTRVILVGDPDQLASVNVGAALRDIVAAAGPGQALEDLLTRLTHNYRSDDAIQRAAHCANDGDLEGLLGVAANSGDLVRVVSSRALTLDAALAHARELVDTSSDVSMALECLGRFTILAATRRGPGSVEWWNERIPSSLGVAPASQFRAGEPILVTRNEPTASSLGESLANGDVGVAVRIDDEVLAAFAPNDAPRLRRISRLPECESAYAMTIHKSQGSEYDEVIVSLPDRASRVLTRELIYTALTRARSKVTLIAPREVLHAALSRRIDRVSALEDRVAALLAERDTVAAK